MASLTRWTWVWIGSGSCWWTVRPGMLQSMGLQRVGHDWATELNWTCADSLCTLSCLIHTILRGRNNSFPSFYRQESRHRDVQWIAQSYPVCKWWSWDLAPGSLAPKSVVLTLFCCLSLESVNSGKPIDFLLLIMELIMEFWCCFSQPLPDSQLFCN